MEEEFILEKWETPCSDSTDLYFTELIDKDELTILVNNISRAGGKDTFQFIFESPIAAYQAVDETYLKYWWKKELGWTFTVKNSKWANSLFKEMLDVNFPNGLIHFVIATSDTCIEVLSEKPPIARKL
ncbi:MAG: hypothetical protein JWN83_842 [Chitinophagaceae bacterium]|nr:hypothetical protein [Chitinophagaceae bacterium]